MTSRCTTGSTWLANASSSGAAGAHLLGRDSAIVIGSGSRSTRWCARGELKAPVVIGRDHLDSGSGRLTQSRDRSDAKMAPMPCSDWPLLNALLNTASGATWVSIHHGGGVGMGFSQHAGVVIVCDGTEARGQTHRARAVE